MEGLTHTFLSIISGWDKTFKQYRTHTRAKVLSIGLLMAMGRKTISRAISVVGRDQQDWSADYRIFSRTEWSICSLFRPVLQRACHAIDEPFITAAFDDTLVKKTGKKIKGTSWQRDPLGPPFNVNFVWGMRYLQASILLPLYKDDKTPPRSIPVQFSQLPKFKRPGKRGSEEDWQKYKEQTRKYNASTHFVKELRYLRNELDLAGCKEKNLLVSVDGSYCNKTCFRADLPRTKLIGRARKDARLYLKAKEGRRFYDSNSFTPDEIRTDESIPWSLVEIFYGGKKREVRYKVIENVYWKNATKRRPLRLIVIAPTGYRLSKNGRRYYRDPAYILTTDQETDPVILIQKYFDRWQIEVNFREEKDLLGLGEQQVWSEKAIPKAPAFLVATYAALLLASVICFQDKRDDKTFIPLPKWRNRPSKRPSCLDLLILMRREMTRSAHLAQQYGLKIEADDLISNSAA